MNRQKISVLMPAYRAAGTICASLDSVFSQKRMPDEVIVILDGVVDDTPAKLEPYKSRIRLVVQKNSGVACTRNNLVKLANGDLLAFLDADDLWHPDYLTAQEEMMATYPEAVVGFTGHIRFKGDNYLWSDERVTRTQPELTDPVTFFNRLNIVSAMYGSMSLCCVRRSAFSSLGPEPFSSVLSGPEDCYLLYQLAMQGPIAFQPAKLLAYRLTAGSLSEDKIRVLSHWVKAFEMLEERFMQHPSVELRRSFSLYYAQKRREYAKTLLGVERTGDARRELHASLSACRSLVSWAKTFGLLGASYMPRKLQPKWPSSVRVVRS